MPPINVSYTQAETLVTVLISNFIAIALAKGAITASTADSLNNNVAQIGAILIFVVINASLVIGNQWHRLKYGPVPLLPGTGVGAVVAALPVNSPSAPSYAAASTGPGDAPVMPLDLPATAV